MSHKNFCILPFIHLATTTEGTCRLCCKVSKDDVILDDTGKPYNVNTHTIEEIWNSKHYQSLRERVWADEKLPECRICFDEEETFYSAWTKERKDELPSKRRKENQKWLHKPQSKLSRTVDDIVANPIIHYYDIRVSNLCNLKCRMCWPHFSSQIVKEQKDFKKQGLKTWYHNYDVIEWDTSLLWKSIDEKIVADIEEITFVGGEPTLHDEMYDLLERLIASGMSKNIRLKLTSNLTNVQQRLLDSFDHFKSVEINGSIDGVGAVNDYIRHPSDWATVEKNIDKLLQMFDVRLNLTPVVQVYNIFHIHDLVKWYVDKWIYSNKGDRFVLSLDLLYDPKHLNINLLNTHGKELWYWQVYVPTIEYLDYRLNNIELQTKTTQNFWKVLDNLRRRIVNIALYLEVIGYDDDGKLRYWFAENETVEISKQRENCLAYTQQLDKHRKQEIKDIMKDFYEVIK